MGGVSNGRIDSHRRRRSGQVTSRYHGVRRNTRTRKFEAYIRIMGRHVHLGCHAEEEKAARCYDMAALHRYLHAALARPPLSTRPTFLHLNFPLEDYADDLLWIARSEQNAMALAFRLETNHRSTSDGAEGGSGTPSGRRQRGYAAEPVTKRVGAMGARAPLEGWSMTTRRGMCGRDVEKERERERERGAVEEAGMEGVESPSTARGDGGGSTGRELGRDLHCPDRARENASAAALADLENAVDAWRAQRDAGKDKEKEKEDSARAVGQVRDDDDDDDHHHHHHHHHEEGEDGTVDKEKGSGAGSRGEGGFAVNKRGGGGGSVPTTGTRL